MRKLILIIVGVAAIAVIGLAVYLSAAGSADQPTVAGTSTCAPRDDAAATGDDICEVPGDNDKPGEAPKG